MRKVKLKILKIFGLIETLVACSILIIIISAVVALGVAIVNSVMLSRHRVTAYYLAQEMVETSRQIRDSNLIDGNDATNWKTLNYEWGIINPYRDVVMNYTTIYQETPVGNRLFLGPSGYGQDITIDGVIYRRKIVFAPSGVNVPELDTAEKLNDNAMRAIITVSWKFKGVDQQVEIRELLTNWKQQL